LPSEKDVEVTRKIIKAYEEARARGLGATSLEGRMIDEAAYKMATKTLRMYAVITKSQSLKI